jgi:protein-S-isoprenylcysteine O-methyltransferase Ste14
MQVQWIHRFSVLAIFLFSLAALGTILTAVVPIVLTGQVPPPARDEGTQAHIFQLSIAALLPIGLVFCATADWKRPWHVGRALAIPAAVVLAAVALLYYFEHVIY